MNPPNYRPAEFNEYGNTTEYCNTCAHLRSIKREPVCVEYVARVTLYNICDGWEKSTHENLRDYPTPSEQELLDREPLTTAEPTTTTAHP
jgi:Fe-S-cluster-containing dehydrogenase component